MEEEEVAPTQADKAVSNYLTALNKPDKLKDGDGASKLHEQLGATDDPVARLQLQQQIIDADNIDPSRYEDAFVTHAKAWADHTGVGVNAFLAEGVDPRVLRRARFKLPRGQPDRGRHPTTRTRKRASAEDVRKAIPSGEFTIKQVQEASGASPAAVRRIVGEEIDAGHIKEAGTDPEHSGPGRAPTQYERT